MRRTRTENAELPGLLSDVLRRKSDEFHSPEAENKGKILKVYEWVQSDADLGAKAQQLYGQIMARPPHIWTATASSNTTNRTIRDRNLDPSTIWGIVAIVASRFADEASNCPQGYQSLLSCRLHEILLDAKLSISTFLQYLCSLCDRDILDAKLSSVLTNMREQFIHITLLYGKYEPFWNSIFANASAGTAINNQSERRDLLYRAGWLIFLIAKQKHAAEYSGLGQLYLLLIASIHLVITKLSITSIEAEVAAALSSLGTESRSSDDKSFHHAASSDSNLLPFLCASPKIDQKLVERACQQLEQTVFALQADEHILHCPTTEWTTINPIMAIFHDQVLAENVNKLSQYYEQTYLRRISVLDERFYFDAHVQATILPHKTVAKTKSAQDIMQTDARMLSPKRAPSAGTQMLGRPPTSPTPSGVSLNWYSPPPVSNKAVGGRYGTRCQSVFSSPLRPAQTPITAAVEINHWIRTTLHERYDPENEAFHELQCFFKNAKDSDATRDFVSQLLDNMMDKLIDARKKQWTSSRRRSIDLSRSLERVSPSKKHRKLDSLSSSLCANPFLEQSDVYQQSNSEVDYSLVRVKEYAVTLFYLVLQSMLCAERLRLKSDNFEWLLRNRVFLSATFACCLEVILKAYSLITLSFPFLLQHLHVNVFDFGLVMESFVKHIPKRLPSALKRHLRDIEQMIMASLAWRSDSGLYRAMQAMQRETFDGKSEDSAAATDPSSFLSAPLITCMDDKEIKSVRPCDRAIITSRGLHVFFRKVFALAASRIYRLGSMLSLEPKILNQAWTAVKECLTQHQVLARDRHVDHIILCSLYGVCKVNHVQPEVTFRRIIDVYKKLQTPHWALHRPGTVGSTASDVIRHIRLVNPTDPDQNAQVPRGDIIKFYNVCFIPNLKVFLLQFQSQHSVQHTDAVIVDHTISSPSMTSTCDAEVVAEAAAIAVRTVMKEQSDCDAVPKGNGSPLKVFRTVKTEALPIAMELSSPQRVPESNIYMSPLPQTRLQHHRNRMTPRSHALYAFGESPSRDLAVINRSVNAPSISAAFTSASKNTNKSNSL